MSTDRALAYTVFSQREFSTLRVYRNGEFTVYQGPRNREGIISYMTK